MPTPDDEPTVFEKYMNTPVVAPDDRVVVLLVFAPGLNEADVESFLSNVPPDVMTRKEVKTFNPGRGGNPVLQFSFWAQ